VALPEPRDRVAAVGSGRVDIATSFPEESLPRSGTVAGFHVVRRAGTGISLLGFPMEPVSPFADRRVRRAAAFAIDRARLARTAAGGVLVPASQIVPAEVFGYSSDLGPIPYDVPAARRLMSEAGHADGFDFDCIFPTSGTGVALDVVDQLKVIGIRLRATALPWDEFYKRRLRPSSQVVLFNWFASTGDVSNILDAVLHSATDGYGAANTFSYRNAELDGLIELSDRTLMSASRRETLALAMKLVREDMPVVPLVQRINLYVVRDGLRFVPRADRLVGAMDVTR
jgi:peptide/nickel transport system substrate-binding protein